MVSKSSKKKHESNSNAKSAKQKQPSNPGGSVEYSAVKHIVKYAELPRVPNEEKGRGKKEGGIRGRCSNELLPLQSLNCSTVIRKHTILVLLFLKIVTVFILTLIEENCYLAGTVQQN